MCSYREKKAEPQELLQLDGYTVDYTDPQPGTGLAAPMGAVLATLKGSPLSPSPCLQLNCDQHYSKYVCVYTDH